MMNHLTATPITPTSQAPTQVPANRRILIVDDNDAIHNDFRKTLGSRMPTSSANLDDAEAALFGDGAVSAMAKAPVVFDLDGAVQGEEGYDKVQRALAEGRPYSVAFVDMRMPPGWDGLQTIENFWKKDPDLQVVICSAYSDHSWDEIIERLGWTDRLLMLKKPFDSMEVWQLASALTKKWELAQRAQMKMAELEKLVEHRTAELRVLALHDKLTGLPNRTLLRDRIGVAIERARRNPDYKYGVLFLDFDRFKVINDSLGHEAGDMLLVQIAQRIRMALRDTDTLAKTATVPDANCAARLGGDEFVVLLDELHEHQDVVRVADRLLQVLAAPYDLNGHQARSSASIGITTNRTPYDTADAVIRDADNAMYRAKANGRANFVIFDEAMYKQAMDRLTLDRDLRKATELGQIEVYYQPIINLGSGNIEGFEALARWRHPERGMVSPGDFIPIAEELGIIIEMGRHILTEAWAQLRLWSRLFPELPTLSVSVNLSRKQLVSPKIVDQIESLLAGSPLEPRRLRLEITESMAMQNAEHSVAILGRIRELGVQLVIDDFGSGHSSLSCLHRFPVNGLKIDRSFIESISERREYAAVVQAIVTLTRSLHMNLVAEGIETTDQFALLQGMGCEMAQGYLFARPMPAADVEPYIHRHLAKACAA